MEAIANQSISYAAILATGGYDRTVRIWQANTGNCMRTIPFHQLSQVNALVFTPDKRLVAACGYRCVRMYDVNSNFDNPVIAYEGVTKNVTRVGFQEDFKWMFTAGEDGHLRIWDMSSAVNQLECLRGVNCLTPINTACLHPNQVEIAVGLQNGGIFLFDVRSENHTHLIPEAGAAIQDIAISPNGQYLAAVNNKGSCYICTLSSSSNQNLSTLVMKQRITAHPRYVLRCRFSPDSSMLVTTSDVGFARIWEAVDFQMLTEFSVRNYWMWDANFSDDSKCLFTASSDGIARLWNLETMENEVKYIGHSSAITALAFKN